MSSKNCEIGKTEVEGFIKYECFSEGSTVRGIRPIGCVPSNKESGDVIKNGATYEAEYFFYLCTVKGLAASYKITNCKGPGGKKMNVGQSVTDKDGQEWKCVRGSDGQIELQSAAVDSCEYKGKKHKINEYFREGDLRLKCVLKSGKVYVYAYDCYVGKVAIPVGKYGTVEGKYYQCAGHVTQPENCKAVLIKPECKDEGGWPRKPLETWDLNGARYQCALNASGSPFVKILGCVYEYKDKNATKLIAGNRVGAFNQSVYLHCKIENGTYKLYILTNATCKDKTGVHKLGESWIVDGAKVKCYIHYTAKTYVYWEGCLFTYGPNKTVIVKKTFTKVNGSYVQCKLVNGTWTIHTASGWCGSHKIDESWIEDGVNRTCGVGGAYTVGCQITVGNKTTSISKTYWKRLYKVADYKWVQCKYINGSYVLTEYKKVLGVTVCIGPDGKEYEVNKYFVIDGISYQCKFMYSSGNSSVSPYGCQLEGKYNMAPNTYRNLSNCNDTERQHCVWKCERDENGTFVLRRATVKEYRRFVGLPEIFTGDKGDGTGDSRTTQKPEPKTPKCSDMHPVCQMFKEVCSGDNGWMNHKDHNRLRYGIGQLARACYYPGGSPSVQGLAARLGQAMNGRSLVYNSYSNNPLVYPSANCPCPRYTACPWHYRPHVCPSQPVCACANLPKPDCRACDVLKLKAKGLIKILCPKSCDACEENMGDQKKVVLDFLKAYWLAEKSGKQYLS